MRLSYDGQTAVFLSVYRPPPSPQPTRQNKLTMQCFCGSFLICEDHVSCDRLFVVGDLNVHLDKPSDPSTSALNVILDNLSLHQLVKVPAHRRGHTLDWLITNRATVVLDLTAVDMLLSDQCVISFDLLLRNLAPMSISGCVVPLSQSARNLGFSLDETLSMDAHIEYLCRISPCHLRRIGNVHSLMSTDAANKLAVSLILSSRVPTHQTTWKIRTF